MPLPRGLAQFNRAATNRVALRFAGRVPPFVVLEHRGRHSGTTYRTPLMAFRTSTGYALALTYGPGADWVRNVIAAGGAEIARRGRRERLGCPRLAGAGMGLPLMPRPVRIVLRLTGVDDYLLLNRAAEAEGEGRT